MPPVEHSGVPGREAVTLADLKVVGKAMELPVVQDTVHGLEMVKHSISENAHLKSAAHMVEEGFKALSVNSKVQDGVHRVQDGVKYIQDNKTVHETVSSVTGKMRPHVDSLIRQVPGAVDKLDNYACNRIDNLTSAIPALSNPTPQLMESAKEAAVGYCAIVNEYIASFTAAQISLSVVDKSLSVVEKSVNFFKPDDQDSGLLCRTYGKIRSVRRSLRALRRAGSRRNSFRRTPLSRVGLVGRVANLLSVNSVLRIAGLELVPAQKSFKQKAETEGGEVSKDESQGSLKDLQADLAGYQSDLDPDYPHPDLSEDSEDSLDSDEQTEDEAAEEDQEEFHEKKRTSSLLYGAGDSDLDDSNPFSREDYEEKSDHDHQ